jgi:hypothetical protein
MTTITIDRATVEQALEALEADCGGRCNAEYNPCWQREVAETLRAALARQAEPVAVDAAYQRWLEDTHAPALRRMDSQGAFAAGWQAALAQQAEPVQRSQDWHAGVLEGHLRERERWLAQQAEPVAVAERERIAAQWDGCVTHRLDTFGPVDIGASIRAGELVGPAQQAEPVQEPAAKVELMMTGGNAGLATRIVEIDHHLRDRLRPGQLLYTAPPKRQPLTDEQISDLWCEVSNTDFVTADTHVFARAVESKLQEKNT